VWRGPVDALTRLRDARRSEAEADAERRRAESEVGDVYMSVEVLVRCKVAECLTCGGTHISSFPVLAIFPVKVGHSDDVSKTSMCSHCP